MLICIAGKNSIAVNAVGYLIENLNIKKEEILACTNKTDTGENGWQPSFLLFCKNSGIKTLNINELYDISDLIFISLEFDKIIKPEKFKRNARLFNIHFSKLPKYKGMYTSIFPILYGENESGVTLHEIDEGIDTGDIIDITEFKIDINDTSRDLYFKYLYFGLEIFKKNISLLLMNKYSKNPQQNIGSSYYSKHSIDFNNIVIDFNRTSYQIHNQIRAFIFKEYQLPKVYNYYIKRSFLTNERIRRNYFEDKDGLLILSGIDGYKIELEKA